MNTDLLLATYSFISSKKDAFAQEFYAQLFIKSPEVYHLFTGRRTDMQQQGRLLMQMLSAVIVGLKNDPAETMQVIALLGKRHQKYNVPEQLYDLVGEVLIQTLKDFLKDVWTPEKEATWVEAYTLIKILMLDAYEVQSDH